ncbi:MAG: tRNA glutamyl-Q(34) synthetase GluQRS [Paracoccaceae bacterium]
MGAGPYITRFAPSPTGPLHLGHAYSALIAFERAQKAGGQFLLRIEDLDAARSREAWEAQIYADLAWLGISWPAPVLRQSEHSPRYTKSIEALIDQGFIYPCSCTRGDIRAALSAPQEGAEHLLYPGICRGRDMISRKPGDALRLDLEAALKALTTPLTYTETGPDTPGPHEISPDQLRAQIGDAVLGRKEGAVAYALACVVDDAYQGITEVVRGADLAEFTGLQVLLQRLLGLPTPLYHHHRLIRDEAGKRLAKRDDARAIAKFREDGASPEDIRAMVGF